MKQNTGQRDIEHKIKTQPSGNMEDNTINCTGYEENIPKVSKSEENGNLDVLALAEDMTSTENNDKNFTPECTDKLHNCVQDSPAHETYSKKTGVDDSTSKRKSACILPSTHTESARVIPSTHTESACVIPNTGTESACIMPNTHTEAAYIMPSIHIESTCVISNTDTESTCTMPNTHTESACIMPSTHTEAACIMPSIHTEAACIMPSIHIESTCVIPNTDTESACIMPNTHTEAAYIMPSIHIESACTMPSIHTEAPYIMPSIHIQSTCKIANTHTEAAYIMPSIHIKSACTMPSTSTEAACIMSNTQRDAVEWTQVDSDTEISKDSFQTYDNSEQKPACDNARKNKCNGRNMKSPNLSNVSTSQNSSQYSGLVIVNKDLSKLFSSSLLSDPPYVIFPTTNLHNTTCRSPITVNARNTKFAQITEKEEHNLEKELFSVILLQGIVNETKKEREHGKKTCKKRVTFSSSLTKATEDSLKTNSSKNSGDELLMENTNTSLKNDNITDSIMVRFTHGFLSVMAHMCNFAFSRFSSAISEAWEATTTEHKDGYVKYDGPKPRPSLQSHFNRMASKRRLLPSYADETESEMKIVKRSCRVPLVQSNDSEKLNVSSETRLGNS
jgi:hypothetical protein